MPLPLAARRRLAEPLRKALQSSPPARDWHTILLDRRIWARYSEALTAAATAFIDSASRPPDAGAGFGEYRTWASRLLEARDEIYSLLHLLQPFEPFDQACATRLVGALDGSVCHMASALEEGRPLAQDFGELGRAATDWPSDGGVEGTGLLKQVFGMDCEPVDEGGEFKPGRVFEYYKYDHGTLLSQLAPHLSSLGIPVVVDALACVSVVGWIASAEDPVAAYASMDGLLALLLAVQTTEVVEHALAHFRYRERAARQARRRILATVRSVNPETDHESRALALAEIYKRVVEGPVRHYGWALRCLTIGTWSTPPTLTPLREALVAQGGLVRHIAESCILVELRNGEVHENLEWDGLQHRYLVENGSVEYERVVAAVASALSFERGWEAAVASFRALMARPADTVPSAEDEHMMPAWQRAEAYFGTNGLRLLTANFNATTAIIRVATLEQRDVNPCFQALLCARRLLPEVHSFEVYVEAAPQPAIVIDTAALDCALPVWNQALATFDRMPFAAFLPANLAARSVSETDRGAVRAVAWIAVDDVLDAVDGGPISWDEAALDNLAARVDLVVLALSQCLKMVPADSNTRLRATLEDARELQAKLAGLDGRPLATAALNDWPATTRLRHAWSVWGPVPRLPAVRDTTPDGTGADRQPRLRGHVAPSGWQRL